MSALLRLGSAHLPVGGATGSATRTPTPPLTSRYQGTTPACGSGEYPQARPPGSDGWGRPRRREQPPPARGPSGTPCRPAVVQPWVAASFQGWMARPAAGGCSRGIGERCAVAQAGGRHGGLLHRAQRRTRDADAPPGPHDRKALISDEPPHRACRDAQSHRGLGNAQEHLRVQSLCLASSLGAGWRPLATGVTSWHSMACRASCMQVVR